MASLRKICCSLPWSRRHPQAEQVATEKQTSIARPALSPATTPLFLDGWLRERYAKQAVSDIWAASRYAACRALKENGISCLVWFEDALAYYGVDIVCFNVHIIVNDVDAAQAALTAAGEWVALSPAPRSQFLHEIQSELRFLRRPADVTLPPGVPDNRVTTQVLMPAALWGGAVVLPDVAAPEYQQPGAAALWPFVPRLPDLFNGLLAQWLDAMPAERPVLRRYLAGWILSVARQLPIVTGDADEFAARLAPENRQFFLDVLAEIDIAPAETHAHERAVRDAIRAGTHALQACSVSKDDERYFTPAQKRRIAARQRLRQQQEEGGGRESDEESIELDRQQRAADDPVDVPANGKMRMWKRFSLGRWSRANVEAVATATEKRPQESKGGKTE